jgi:hypothetical protein
MLHLAGRTESTLQKVARDIEKAGGRAETAVVGAVIVLRPETGTDYSCPEV